MIEVISLMGYTHREPFVTVQLLELSSSVTLSHVERVSFLAPTERKPIDNTLKGPMQAASKGRDQSIHMLGQVFQGCLNY